MDTNRATFIPAISPRTGGVIFRSRAINGKKTHFGDSRQYAYCGKQVINARSIGSLVLPPPTGDYCSSCLNYAISFRGLALA